MFDETVSFTVYYDEPESGEREEAELIYECEACGSDEFYGLDYSEEIIDGERTSKEEIECAKCGVPITIISPQYWHYSQYKKYIGEE